MRRGGKRRRWGKIVWKKNQKVRLVVSKMFGKDNWRFGIGKRDRNN